jgi:hypothetical protein
LALRYVIRISAIQAVLALRLRGQGGLFPDHEIPIPRYLKKFPVLTRRELGRKILATLAKVFARSRNCATNWRRFFGGHTSRQADDPAES